MKGKRKDVGGWGPSCVQHGYSSSASLTGSSFRVPSDTGLTLNDVIGIFLRNPSETPWLIETIQWPGNQGCSGLGNNLKFSTSLI
jgi:hypothetical protein